MIRFSYTFLLLLAASIVWAQNTGDKDLLLVGQEYTQTPASTDRVVQFPKPSKQGLVASYNPFSLIFRSLLFGYQKIISVQFYAECLYEPSCSDFSKHLIHHHGLLKGVLGSADRLTRCNPLSDKDIPEWKRHRLTGKVKESTDIYLRKK